MGVVDGRPACMRYMGKPGRRGRQAHRLAQLASPNLQACICSPNLQAQFANPTRKPDRHARLASGQAAQAASAVASPPSLGGGKACRHAPKSKGKKAVLRTSLLKVRYLF